MSGNKLNQCKDIVTIIPAHTSTLNFLSFANIKNSRAVFRTHKFFCLENCYFRPSIRNVSLQKKMFFFSSKYKKSFYFKNWLFLGNYKKFILLVGNQFYQVDGREEYFYLKSWLFLGKGKKFFLCIWKMFWFEKLITSGQA